MIGPANTVGPTGLSRNSNSVTIPKFPPPPRTPQKRSAFSPALALTNSPSAVTRSTPRSWSIVRPYLRSSQPIPPPRVRPAKAGVGDDPSRDGEPEELRLAIEGTQQNPSLCSRGARLWIHADPVHLPEVDHHPVIAHAQTRVAVAATPHRDQ